MFVKFEFDFLYDDRMIRNMYLGIYECDVVKLLHRLLREGDTFIDVGANIGYLSAIALSIIGKSGQAHCFEPVHYNKLKIFKNLNPHFNISINDCALGDADGNIEISIAGKFGNIGMNTLVPELLNRFGVENTLTVPIRRLDEYIIKNNINKIKIIKIDVEGYEYFVLKGLKAFFDAGNRPIIIVEISPIAFSIINVSLAELGAYMNQYGYECTDIEFRSIINLNNLDKMTNVVFIYNGALNNNYAI